MRAARFRADMALAPSLALWLALALAAGTAGAQMPPAQAPKSPSSRPPAAAVTPARPAVPPWQVTMMPWQAVREGAKPWQADSTLRGKFHPQYPDDLPVLFLNPNRDSAKAGRNEVMWVTVTAKDTASGRYLGVLLNQPHFLKTAIAFDNVEFAWDTAHRFPVARDDGHGVAMAGWPASAEPDSFARLVDGIRAYRSGRNGHHMPGIERCIQVLSPLASNVPPRFRPDERFVTHFVLGRCLAEKYETESAVQAFKAALAVDSTDVNAHMALLAEYSILVHSRRPARAPEAEAKWERAFTDQLALVRARFPDEPGVRQILALIMQPPENVRTDTLKREAVERGQRVGWATFRWKRR